MAVLGHRLVIAVPDLARSIAWYRDVLGFRIHDVEAPGWAFLSHGRCHVMAGECPEATPARDLGDHSYVAYLDVDDIDAFYARVVTAGADLLKPLRDEPWGMREFGVRTIDGHRIMVGQPMRAA